VLTLLIFVGEAVRDAFDPRRLPGGALGHGTGETPLATADAVRA
jgi:hypothetical protein